MDCPGCGMLHSLWALICGDFRESLVWHPMGVVVAAWIGYVALTRGLQKPVPPVLSKWFSHLFVGGLLIHWVVKIVTRSF